MRVMVVEHFAAILAKLGQEDTADMLRMSPTND
jgi:hypothetical protein